MLNRQADLPNSTAFTIVQVISAPYEVFHLGESTGEVTRNPPLKTIQGWLNNGRGSKSFRQLKSHSLETLLIVSPKVNRHAKYTLSPLDSQRYRKLNTNSWQNWKSQIHSRASSVGSSEPITTRRFPWSKVIPSAPAPNWMPVILQAGLTTLATPPLYRSPNLPSSDPTTEIVTLSPVFTTAEQKTSPSSPPTPNPRWMNHSDRSDLLRYSTTSHALVGSIQFVTSNLHIIY
jgi:hypothetical protein